MEYRIVWGGPVEDVSIRVSGQAAAGGFMRYVDEALNDSRWRPTMRVLFDQRDADGSALTSGDFRARADFLIQEKERLAGAHVAIVVGRALQYGLMRMIQGFSNDWGDGEGLDIALFYTVEEARDWLSRFPAPAGPVDRA